jgi:hypothetical protein
MRRRTLLIKTDARPHALGEKYARAVHGQGARPAAAQFRAESRARSSTLTPRRVCGRCTHARRRMRSISRRLCALRVRSPQGADGGGGAERGGEAKGAPAARAASAALARSLARSPWRPARRAQVAEAELRWLLDSLSQCALG